MVTLDQSLEMAGLPTVGGPEGKLRKVVGMFTLLGADDLKREASPDEDEEPAAPVPPALLPPVDEAESDETPEPPPIPRRAPEAAATTPPAAEKRRDPKRAGVELRRRREALRATYVRQLTGRLEAYFEALADRVVSRAQQTRGLVAATAKSDEPDDVVETKAPPREAVAKARKLIRATDTRELDRIIRGYFDAVGADAVQLGNLVYDLGVTYGDSPARMKTLARAARSSTQIVSTVTDDAARAIAKADRRGWT